MEVTDAELREAIEPKIEEARQLLQISDEQLLNAEAIERLLMDATHVIYDACRAIADEQIARNHEKYQNHVQPKPVALRPTLEDIL